MAKRISISEDFLKIDDIVMYKQNVESAIKYYFRKVSIDPVKAKFLLKELELNSTFLLLASIEAYIRIDYEYRVKNRFKDELSKELRELDKKYDKPYHVPIGKLCDIYKKYYGSLFSKLKTAFKLRHWLAHGRYWIPQFGRKYTFNDVYNLAKEIEKIIFVEIF